MTIDRASVLLPCASWDDFPTHLGEEAAAEFLAAWTALWHPALLAVTKRIPSWRPAEEPPEPTTLENELVLVPPPSRVRMPSDWCDRLRATAPSNPPPVETVASRVETVAALLNAANLPADSVEANLAADFLALGFAYLQVDLLTRSMRYSSVLDDERFESALVAAATAAVGGNHSAAHDELIRAFDLLSDARNHVYSVDFYVIDVTLVADSTLGDSLRRKLAAGSPTNVLITGEQIERLAGEFPATLQELKRAIDAETASIVGGSYGADSIHNLSPEALLADLDRGRNAARHHLGREFDVFGQFNSTFTHLLPQVLKGLGFRGALHAAFDGRRLPRADQCKTNWGPDSQTSVEALAATPLDAGRDETWLQFAERVSDTIARDHVATVLLAGWPGAESEYFDDLRRTARFGSLLGKLVTLDEYFRVSREPDDWTTFFPREYPQPLVGTHSGNPISTSAAAYRADVHSVHHQLGEGLTAVAGAKLNDQAGTAVINPWNFASSCFIGLNPLTLEQPQEPSEPLPPRLLSDVLGCGYATLAAAVAGPPVPLAEEYTLRNERLHLVVSPKTGGIQSLRTHRDRNTRVSQRLVFHHAGGGLEVESQMVADSIEITRNDALVGEITSTGRLLDQKNDLLANFAQRTRVSRGLGPAIIDVVLEPARLPAGEVWKSYYASCLAWAEDALSIRRGEQWTARDTDRESIQSPEFVDIDDVFGRITCFPLGLPFHRRSAPNRLDTLLLVAGEEGRRFQLAIGLDQPHPTSGAIGALSAGRPCLARFAYDLPTERGWFLHLGAPNVLVTHIAPLPEPAVGVRLRVLETEGRETRTKLSGFREFKAARTTDFRANPIEVLSVSDGRADFDIGPYQWIQIEAEW